MFSDFFQNEFNNDNGVHIIEKSDSYTKNFGKQWEKYNSVQIDSVNNFDISENFLKNILFNDLEYLKNKNILEIGCGAGRFTEHIVKYSKLCISVDMSSAIFHNVAKNSKNLILVKSDFTKLLSKKKFDIVICRGVLQHTPNPLISIKKLHEFIDIKGEIFFDIYPMPKIGYLHPKYLFWRPFISYFFKYEQFENYLHRNIEMLLRFKRYLKKITKSNFISDSIIPIWDYDKRIKLSKKQLMEWSILDTLDGIYAKYDKPKSNKQVKKFLKKENLNLIKTNLLDNIFHTKLN